MNMFTAHATRVMMVTGATAISEKSLRQPARRQFSHSRHEHRHGDRQLDADSGPKAGDVSDARYITTRLDWQVKVKRISFLRYACKWIHAHNDVGSM